jgi:cytochrome P450
MRSTVPTAVGLVIGPDTANPFHFSPALAELLRERPLSRMEYPDGHVGWIATSRAAVRAVLSDHRFSVNTALMHLPSGPSSPASPDGPPPGAFTDLDPPDHTRYRKLLTGKFTTRRMHQLADRIEQLTANQLDAMERQGQPADLVDTFARPIPALMICELLGVSYDQREQFQDSAMALAGAELSAEEFAAKFAALQAFMYELVQAKRAHPGDDLLSDLLDTDLTDAELAVIGLVLLGAGLDTTANAVALGTYALLLHPDQLAATREDPDRAVEELLRYLSVIPLTVRAALDDVEIDGQVIARGDTVTV